MVRYRSFRWVTIAVSVGLAALPAVPSLAQTQLRLAHVSRPSSHFGTGAAVFAKELARLTGGRIVVDIFPNSTLGNEWEVIKKLQSGALDFTIVTTGPIGNIVPETLIFDIPFLFKDRFHAHAVLDGPIGQGVLNKFPARNLIALAWSGNGFLHLTNSQRAVINPADLKGMKLRTMENEIHIQAFHTLGALPVPLPFKEALTALRQGAVDGQENSISVIVSEKLPHVQPYLTLTGHAYSPALFLISRAIFDKLSARDKKAVTIASHAGAKAQRDRVVEIEAEGIDELRKQGMSVTTAINHTAFKAALKPAYASYAKKFGQDKLDAIVNFAP